MNIGIRIKLFIQTCYQSQLFFAKLVNLDPTYLNRIINNRLNPGVDILSRFNSAGVSLDWLLNGSGSMYSTNSLGEKLKNMVSDSSNITQNTTNKRVISWISENYDNLENFCNIFKIDLQKSHSIIYESAMPDSEYLEILNEAGCNIKWLHTGQGSRFENNPAGTILKMKNKNFQSTIKS
ncbi:MAG: XRE family transcriptional regulator [Bacteroidetes bacterium]|nr:MAG: XRE family transcriptional regulator [Bacteroidota bacterium]